MEQGAHTTGAATVAHAANGVAKPVLPARMTASELKAHIFSSSNERAQFKRELIDFFGVQVELRQPSLEMIGHMVKDSEDDTDKSAAVFILTNYVYVPGTNEHVFDISDTDQLKALPFNEDFNRLTEAFNRITGVNVEKERKNS